MSYGELDVAVNIFVKNVDEQGLTSCSMVCTTSSSVIKVSGENGGRSRTRIFCPMLTSIMKATSFGAFIGDEASTH